jgi:SET domain
LCHEHAGACKLPDLDPEVSMQERIEKRIDEKFDDFVDNRRRRAMTSRTRGKNLFFPGISGGKVTSREILLREAMTEQHDLLDDRTVDGADFLFCLPCDIKDEVHSKPPSYRQTNSLKYSQYNRPPKVALSSGVCNCIEHCADDCINKMLYTECFGDPTKSKSGADKECNCRIGPTCGNRQLGRRNAAKCAPKREKGKGWGLITVNKLKKGDLVQEYTGEVIDTKTKEDRLLEWSKEHPNDPNFYIMALQPSWFIDARDVANLARFINHSCEPNCRLLQINVNGRMHCGIFALRKIDAGEFLSYDYQFDTKHGDKFVCCCGSLICRGTMKGGAQQNGTDAAKKSKAEVWEDAKMSYERDKKFLAEYHEDRSRRLNQVDTLVPNADSGKDELVANGAQIKHRDKARSNRIFLWRNAMLGGDFEKRFLKLDRKGKIKL